MKQACKIRLPFFVLSMLLILSCQKEEYHPKKPDISEKTEVIDELLEGKNEIEGMTQLGERLENPYSLENMRAAWDSLSKKSKVTKNSEIVATHLYIRFKPKTAEELAELKSDSTIVLYDIPLDYEIINNGDFYHDSELPPNQPTYKYTSIPIDKKTSINIEFEVLEELFIPDEDNDTNEFKTNSFASKETINQLVDESLRLTNNLDELERENPLASKRRWRPSGRVRVYDHTTKSYVPVTGLKVRARRWFTTHRGFTNNSGDFRCGGRFRRKANYSIKWDRHEYSIRSGTFGQAILNGPKRRGNWNVNLGRSSSSIVNDKQQYYALIHQGALDYYYGSRFGLTSPPRNKFLRKQLKIAARPKSGQSSYVKARSIYLGADISLQAWGRTSDRVYGTIIHELAHAAHRRVDRKSYNSIVWGAYTGPCTSFNGCQNLGQTANGKRRLMETWATTVETVFVLNRYRNLYRIKSFDYDSDNFQFQRTAAENHYTSAGYDMIDGINQRSIYGSDRPLDRVSGYSIKQLELGLRGAKTWQEWKSNIKARFNNPTEKHLDELFNNWSN